ncbi:hypothetical protein [Nitrobacter vulgaris]|uniref:hypothetical protein n=1 Tax=Nitrobacter vulgaris TaxID=29421 RepID=UPI0011175D63|nr:hypothetical protein [Nitrobacter vulgaris]
MAIFLGPETHAETRRIAKTPQFTAQIDGWDTAFDPYELGGGGPSRMRTGLGNEIPCYQGKLQGK